MKKEIIFHDLDFVVVNEEGMVTVTDYRSYGVSSKSTHYEPINRDEYDVWVVGPRNDQEPVPVFDRPLVSVATLHKFGKELSQQIRFNEEKMELEYDLARLVDLARKWREKGVHIAGQEVNALLLVRGIPPYLYLDTITLKKRLYSWPPRYPKYDHYVSGYTKKFDIEVRRRVPRRIRKSCDDLQRK